MKMRSWSQCLPGFYFLIPLLSLFQHQSNQPMGSELTEEADQSEASNVPTSDLTKSDKYQFAVIMVPQMTLYNQFKCSKSMKDK